MIKKTRRVFCIILGFYFLSFLINLGPVFAATEELEFIPKNSDAVVYINYNPEDPGFSFMTSLWNERFELKETPEKYEAIDQIYSELPFGKIVGAVFLPLQAYDGHGPKAKPIYPEFIIAIETKSKKDIFRKALNVLIKKRKPLKELDYANYKIIYRDKALEPYHGQKDLAAYVQVGNFFVIATTPKQLKLAIDTYKGKLDSISENNEFLKLKKELRSGDAFIFVNNKTREFSDNLKRWEEGEGIRLLLSSGSINSIGLAFDLETKDALRGKVIFVPVPGEEISDIEDDAYFFAEVITRSLTKQNISWISDVKTSGGLVKLQFEGTGFKPIWEEALLRKRIAFLEKEPEEELVIEEIEKSKPETQAGFNNIPKIIFVLVVGLVVLSLLLFLKPKKK